jgi:hypothetical protein
MNVKFKAAWITLGVVGSGLATGFLMSYLPNWAVLVAVLIFALYIVYRASLASLELDDAIDKMNDKFK